MKFMGTVKVNADGLTEKQFLEQYRPGDYERPSVTVDMLVLGMSKSLDSLKLLLIQRGNHPYISCWALPGGFVNMDESAYVAACRELKEETGLENVYLEQIYTFSQPDRDPRMRVIDIAYMALMPVADVKAGDDARDAVWFDVKFTDDRLFIENAERGIQIVYSLERKLFRNGVVRYENFVPSLESEEALAFDHAEIILEGLMRLRNKVEYTDIAFNLVQEEFALSDLQRVYEVILGKEIYKANFRAKIADKVQSLNKKGRSVIGNKSSLLYRYKG